MIIHANLMATMRSLTVVRRAAPGDRFLRSSRCSHITERSISHFGQIAAVRRRGSHEASPCPEDLRACRPTLLFAVPEAGEKFRVGILERIDRPRTPIARHLADRYLDRRRAARAATWGTAAEHAEHEALDRPSRAVDPQPARSRPGVPRRLGRGADPSGPAALVPCGSVCRSPRATGRPRSRGARASTRSTTPHRYGRTSAARGRGARSPRTTRSSCEARTCAPATGATRRHRAS